MYSHNYVLLSVYFFTGRRAAQTVFLSDRSAGVNIKIFNHISHPPLIFKLISVCTKWVRPATRPGFQNPRGVRQTTYQAGGLETTCHPPWVSEPRDVSRTCHPATSFSKPGGTHQSTTRALSDIFIFIFIYIYIYIYIIII